MSDLLIPALTPENFQKVDLRRLADAIQSLQTRFTTWDAFTPTVSGTGATVGNGTIAGRQRRIDKLGLFRLRFVLGTTSAIPADTSFAIHLPSDWTTSPDGTQIVYVRARDASANQRWGGVGAISPSSSGIAGFAVSPGATSITSTSPFTWAVNDEILIQGMIELS